MNKKSIDINDNCLDIIRLLCTFTVFFGHFLTHFNLDHSLLNEMAYFVRGVPVFFFMSGLFVARSLEYNDTKSFLKKRAFRIFPELWVCVLLNLVIILISMGARGVRFRDIIIYLATQLTVFQFYTVPWFRGYGVGVPNGALWTISSDIQFYIVAIFTAKWLSKRKFRTQLIIAAALMLLDRLLELYKSMYAEIIYKLLQCIFIPFAWIFLLGMIVYYNRDMLIPVFIKIRWAVLALYILWRYAVPSSIKELFGGIRYNLVTTIFVLALVTGFGFAYHKRFKKDYSYSFYLYHMVVINFVINNVMSRFENSGQMIVVLTVCILATGAFAFLSHRLVAEQLAHKVKKRL